MARAPLRLHVLLDRALLALPFVDQGGEPDLIVLQLVAVDAQAHRARSAMVLRSATSSPRSPVSLSARPRNSGTTGAEQHRGAQRLQRVFRPHQRAPAACAVRRAAALPAPRRSRSGANRASCGSRCSRPSSGRSRASASSMRVSTPRTWRCDVDQLLIELAAVLADRRDIGLQLLLQLGCASSAAARAASSSCSRCLMASGEAAVRGACCCGASAARPPERAASRQSRRTAARRKAEWRTAAPAAADRCRVTNECPALTASESDQRSLRIDALQAR